MPMQAILLSHDNFEDIVNSDTSVNEFDIDAMLVESDKLYFIPRWDESDQEYKGWAMVPEDTFTESFNADMTKIETEYVEISRK